jgi:Caspase domain
MRSADRGLAKMDAPAGVMIAYSTAPGDVAQDGDGRNSPYSEALARAMREPNQPIEQMFKRTRIAVIGKTSNRQTPWESSSLTGDFFFAAPVAPVRPATLVAPVAAAPAAIAPIVAAPVVVAPTPAPVVKKPVVAPPPKVVAAPAARPVPVQASPVSAPRATVVAAPQTAEVTPVSQSTEKANPSGFRKVLGFFGSSSKRVASTANSKPTSPAADESVNFCSLPVGNWKMAANRVKGEVQVNADRTSLLRIRSMPTVKGKWSCETDSQRIVFNWSNGNVDTTTMTSRNRAMQGTNQLNYKVTYKRSR